MAYVKNFMTFEGHFFPNGKHFKVLFKIKADDLLSESGKNNVSEAFDSEMKYVETSGIGLIKKDIHNNKIEAYIEADPDTLNSIEGYNNMPIKNIVEKELQWLLGSGIIVESVEESN